MSTREVDDRIGNRWRIFVMHHVPEAGQCDYLHVAKQCVHAFIVEISVSALLVAGAPAGDKQDRDLDA